MIYAIGVIILAIIIIAILWGPGRPLTKKDDIKVKKFKEWATQQYMGEDHFMHIVDHKATCQSKSLEIKFDFNSDRGTFNDLAMGKESFIVYIDGKFHILD